MSCDTVVIKEIDRQTVEVHSPGPKGDAGQGVATGGISGDLLVKQSASDYDTAWQSTLDIVSLTPDLDPQAVLNQGQMAWNVDDGTVDVGLNGGDVILQVGQEMMYRVENNTGVTIPNGTLCMYEGTVGNSGKVRVKPYDGTGPSRNILGLATKDILNGGFGYVATFGKVRGIQTDGSNYGETWTNGQLIWAAADGGLTNIKPEAPASLARIGGVINAHGSNGVFFVRVRNGSSLADDETVYLVDQADGDALIWNAANERFEPEPVTQPGDNISTLTNDAAYVDSTGAASAAPVQSVDGKTGAVDLSGDYEPSGSAASAQAFAIQRSNHTGTQTLSTISDAGTAAAADIGTASGELIGTDEANDYYGLQYKPSVAPTLSSKFSTNEHKRYEQYGPEPKTILQQWSCVRNGEATYVDANSVLQTAGINEPRIDYDPATGECRGLLVEPQATRLNTIAAAPVAPENVTVTAVPNVVSFYGTGSVVLSGVATGTINGTGEKDRVYLSVTPTAGTLTLTPSGTVTNLQIETGTILTSVILGEGTAVTRVADTITPTV